MQISLFTFRLPFRFRFRFLVFPFLVCVSYFRWGRSTPNCPCCRRYTFTGCWLGSACLLVCLLVVHWHWHWHWNGCRPAWQPQRGIQTPPSTAPARVSLHTGGTGHRAQEAGKLENCDVAGARRPFLRAGVIHRCPRFSPDSESAEKISVFPTFSHFLHSHVTASRDWFCFFSSFSIFSRIF